MWRALLSKVIFSARVCRTKLRNAASAKKCLGRGRQTSTSSSTCGVTIKRSDFFF